VASRPSTLVESDDEVVISNDDRTFPGIVFVLVPEVKTVKIRLHLDLNPPEDRDAEVERLEVLGATRPAPEPGSDLGARSIPRLYCVAY